MLVTFTAMLDRYLPAIALGPMKNDLGLSDTSVSLVQGVAFSLFYCIAGIHLGRAVDRYNRRNLVALAVLERTEERSVGKDCVSTFVSMGPPVPSKKNKINSELINQN